ncbi:MAG TPA: thioredoxin domain-containing protein, partial [Anaerolineae bacterium]|nr:thioredoxin domain-containing protein [Anaerolineae bacterium]
ALATAKARLREARASRPRPETTSQALTAWNALALHALAEAGFHLARPDYLAAARRNARFLRDHLWDGATLHHIWQQGQAKGPGYLADYAALGLALLALYQATGEVEWFTWAEALAEAIQQRFADPDEPGYFDTAAEHDTPLARLKAPQDSAMPSGNSLTATFYLRLAAFTGRGDLRQRAEALLKPLQAAMARYPTGFGQWLVALDFALGPQQEIAILGDPAAPETQALLAVLRRAYLPRAVWSVAPLPLPPGAPALFHDRRLKEGRPTAYVCQHFACRLPVTTPAALRDQLAAAQSETMEDEDAL